MIMLFFSAWSMGYAQDLILRDESFLQTSEKRQELTYLVSCALPEGTNIVSTLNNEKYSFAGSMGLAPEWSTKPLTEKQQRLISACMLGRTNYFGKKVQISITSDAPDTPDFLKRTDSERKEYPVFEGGFFGNLFIEQPEAFVCVSEESPELTNTLETLHRVCSLPAVNSTPVKETPDLSRCGFIRTGLCKDKNFKQNGTDYTNDVLNIYLQSPVFVSQ